MTQTDIYKDRGTDRFLRIAAAVAAVAALMLTGCAVSMEDTDAVAEEPDKVVYALADVKNAYRITGESDAKKVYFNVICNTDHRVGFQYNQSATPSDGRYAWDLKVDLRGVDTSPDKSYEIKVTATDEAGQATVKTILIKMINPTFPASYPAGFDVIAGNTSSIDLGMTGMPPAGSMPEGYSSVNTLNWGAGSAQVEYADGLVKIPQTLTAGTYTCTLKNEISGPNITTQTTVSPQFTLNVQERPVFVLPQEVYKKDAGSSLDIALDLSETDVPGTWTVEKPAGDKVNIAYTADAVHFKINGLKAEDEGIYKVSFKAAGGAVSGQDEFSLEVYTTVDSGLVTLKDLAPDNVLRVGSESLKTCVKVVSEHKFAMTVENGTAQDVSEKFGLDRSGKIVLNEKVGEGTYKFTFTGTENHKVMVFELTVDYIAPPTISGVQPLSYFTVG